MLLKVRGGSNERSVLSIDRDGRMFNGAKNTTIRGDEPAEQTTIPENKPQERQEPLTPPINETARTP